MASPEQNNAWFNAHYRGKAAFARAYRETIPFLLCEKDGFLVFNNDNKDMLRDSKTADSTG